MILTLTLTLTMTLTPTPCLGKRVCRRCATNRPPPRALASAVAHPWPSRKVPTDPKPEPNMNMNPRICPHQHHPPSHISTRTLEANNFTTLAVIPSYVSVHRATLVTTTSPPLNPTTMLRAHGNCPTRGSTPPYGPAGFPRCICLRPTMGLGGYRVALTISTARFRR